MMNVGNSDWVCKSKGRNQFGDTELRCNINELSTVLEDEVLIQTIKAQASSVACIVKSNRLSPHGNGYRLDSKISNLRQTLEKQYQCKEIDPKIPFLDEPVAGIGTAFLIERRYALTTDHCICKKKTDVLDQALIDSICLVFDFNIKQNFWEKKQIYNIKVIAHSYHKTSEDNRLWADWALLELDREVEDRNYLPVNFKRIEKSIRTDLYMIGFPDGLPCKHTRNGQITKEYESYFESNLDAYEGNSGSPIFDLSTKKVVGILVGGPRDYRVEEGRVVISNNAKNLADGGQAETCQRVDVLHFVLDYIRAVCYNTISSQRRLAKHYLVGCPEASISIDRNQSLKWLQAAYNQVKEKPDPGHGKTCYQLYVVHSSLFKEDKDIEKQKREDVIARRYLREAAKVGYPGAIKILSSQNEKESIFN